MQYKYPSLKKRKSHNGFVTNINETKNGPQYYNNINIICPMRIPSQFNIKYSKNNYINIKEIML